MCLGQTSSTVLSLLLGNILTVKIAHQVLSCGRGGGGALSKTKINKMMDNNWYVKFLGKNVRSFIFFISSSFFYLSYLVEAVPILGCESKPVNKSLCLKFKGVRVFFLRTWGDCLLVKDFVILKYVFWSLYHLWNITYPYSNNQAKLVSSKYEIHTNYWAMSI